MNAPKPFCRRCTREVGSVSKRGNCIGCEFELKEQATKPVQFADGTEHMDYLWRTS